MKILLAHQYYQWRGGEDIAFERQSELLREASYQVATLTRHAEVLSGSTLAKVRAAAGVFHSCDVEQELSRRYEAEKWDWIHVHNWFPLLSPSLFRWAKVHRIPVTLTLHNFRLRCGNGLFLREGRPCEKCLSGSAWNSARYSCYRKNALQSALLSHLTTQLWKEGFWNEQIHTFLALSEFSKTKHVEMGIDPNKIQVLPNPAPAAAGPPLPLEEREGLVFIGRISEEKGILNLLRAYRTLTDRGAILPRLRVVGEGPLLESIRRDCPPNVEILGAKTQCEVLNQIRHSRGLLLPSTCYENLPTTLLEAFSCGTPVLGTKLGSIPELVEPKGLGTTGLLYSMEPDPVRNLGEALLKFVGATPLEWSQWSKNSLRLHAEKFHSDAILKAWKKLGESILR